MSFLFGGGSKPPKPLPPPKVADPNVQQVESDARKRAALARGRQSTILTQGLGQVGTQT